MFESNRLFAQFRLPSAPAPDIHKSAPESTSFSHFSFAGYDPS